MDKRNCVDLITQSLNSQLREKNKGKLNTNIEHIANVTDQGVLIPEYKGIGDKRVKDILKEIDVLKKHTRNLPLDIQKKVFDEFYTEYRANALNGINNKISMANIISRHSEKLNYKEFNGDSTKVMRDILSETERSIEQRSMDNVAMLKNGLDEIGATDLMGDKKFVRDLVNEISNAGLEGTKGISKNPLAQKAATVFKKVTDNIHKTGKDLGLDWKYIDNYMPNMWESSKFGLVDEDEFVKDFMGNLNERAYPGRDKADLVQMLKDFHRDVTLSDFDTMLDLPDGSIVQRRKDSMAKNMLRRRAIHLSPEGQFLMYKKYGSDDFIGDFHKYSKSVGKKFAMMENFGPTPSIGFNQVAKRLIEQSSNPSKFEGDFKKIENQFLRISDPMRFGKGETKLEKIGSSIRGATAATALSINSTLTAAFTDPATFGGWVNSRMNVGMLDGIGTYFSSMAKVLSPENRKEYGKILGIVMDFEMDRHLAKLGMEKGANTNTGKLINFMMKWTGLPAHQALSQDAGMLAGALLLTKHKDVKWGDLDVTLRTSLSREGINPDKWDVIRHPDNVWNYKGDSIMSPEKIRGNSASDLHIESAHALKKFLYRMESGIVVPGSRESSIFNNMDANSVHGQLWRSLGMFKSYPMASWNQLMMIKDFNPASATPTKGNYSAVAQTMIGLMTMMYIKGSLKEMGNGKEPISLVDTKKGTPNMDAIVGLILDSGAGGLYADTLLTDYDKHFGITMTGKVAGPVFSKVGDMYEVVQDLGNKDVTARNKGMKVLKKLGDNIPINNIPVIKPMLDYMILNKIRDNIDPTWKAKRMRALVQKDIFGNETSSGYSITSPFGKFDTSWVNKEAKKFGID